MLTINRIYKRWLPSMQKFTKKELVLCKSTSPTDVNTAWSPKKIEAFFSLKSKNNLVLTLGLDENLNSTTLRKLFLKHITNPYCSESIISEIAGHSNTPIDILRTLARIGKDSILSPLALNKKMTKDIAIIILEATNEYRVLEHLILNHSTPLSVLRMIEKNTKDKDLLEVIQIEYKCRNKGGSG